MFPPEVLQSILALGSGGSSKIVFPEENRMERVENVKSVDDYIGRIDEMIRMVKFVKSNLPSNVVVAKINSIMQMS